MTDTHPDATTGGESRGLGAWILLFGSLTVSAGQGLYLYAFLTRFRPVPNFDYLLKATGITGTAVMLWFMLCIPLAAIAFFARGWIQRKAWLRPAALGAAIGSAGAFLFYASMMLAGMPEPPSAEPAATLSQSSDSPPSESK